MKKIKFLPQLALFAAALIWGTSFVLMKNSVDVFPPFMLLGVRFTIGSAILILIFWKKFSTTDVSHLWRGVVIGVFLFAAYATQTIGITDTTPGKNAFLTASYCIMVPFMAWIVNRVRPSIYNFIAAVICLSGIGLVSLKGGFTMSFGDSFTLIGGFFFAAHMIAISKLSRDHDPVILTILQFATSAVLSWIFSACSESWSISASASSWTWLFYLAVFPTALCLLLQNVGQKGTSPSAASLILSLESVFGIIFSLIFYADEEFTLRLAIGFIMIFIAIVISETQLSFLKRKSKG